MADPDTSSMPLFDLPDEVREVQSWVRTFAERHVRPMAAAYDDLEATPWPVIQEAARAGLYSPDFALKMLGDPTGLSIPVVFEEMYRSDGGMAQAILSTFLPMAALLVAGTSGQQQEWMPALFGTVSEPAVAALCTSEPEAGSDAAAIRTHARFDEASREWILDGTKTWATNGGIAGVHVVSAVVDPTIGARGHALFLVPPRTAGLSQGRKFSKHGLRASHTAEVMLDDVRIPAELVLDGKDALDERLARAHSHGHVRAKVAMATFEATRPGTAAAAVGVARAAYEVALDYAKTRRQFGRPIITNQSIAFMLADMATEIDAARLLTWRASNMIARGRALERGEGSMAKVTAAEVAVRTTQRAMQILGGNGYTRDYPVERWSRDAKVFTIYEGTSEIQRLLISRSISGMRIE